MLKNLFNITKHIEYLLILLIFVLPLNHTLISLLPTIIFILWLIEGNFRHKWNILKTEKIFWIFILLIFILFLSLIFGDSIYNGYWPQKYDHGYQFLLHKYILKFLIFPVLLTNMTKQLFKNMISAFLLAMLISEILSYGIFFEFWTFERTDETNPSPFIHHIYYSIFLVLTIFILLIRFKKEDQLLLKTAYILFALTALSNLFVNVGRSGQLAVVISFGYFIISHFELSKKNILISFSTVIVVITIAYNLSPLFQKRMMYTQNSLKEIKSGDYDSSFGQRIAVWIISIDILKQNPILGVGVGNLKEKIKEVQEEKYPQRAYISGLRHIHNQFLQTYLEGGIITFILLVGIFVMLFTTNFSEYDGYVKVFAIGLLILFLVDTPLRLNIGTLYIWLFTGMFFGFKRYDTTQKQIQKGIT